MLFGDIDPRSGFTSTVSTFHFLFIYFHIRNMTSGTFQKTLTSWVNFWRPLSLSAYFLAQSEGLPLPPYWNCSTTWWRSTRGRLPTSWPVSFLPFCFRINLHFRFTFFWVCHASWQAFTSTKAIKPFEMFLLDFFYNPTCLQLYEIGDVFLIFRYVLREVATYFRIRMSHAILNLRFLF